MDEEAFQQSIRKFLRTVGVRSQQEIEKAVAQARADGRIGDDDSFPATMTLDVAGLKLNVTFDGEIRLS
ncbi:MAG: DUF6494 family protein [Burkholderiaceae bacterium]|nr:DUF6494 family protein [Burkholderiaceae bacterium]